MTSDADRKFTEGIAAIDDAEQAALNSMGIIGGVTPMQMMREQLRREDTRRCGCSCCNCLDDVHCKSNDGISNCAVTDDPPGHCCQRPDAAPGDQWACPICHRVWTAASAGPLDIRWRLDDGSEE